MPLLRFAVEIQLIRHHDYYLCVHARTQTRVIITTKLKYIIDTCQWSHCTPEDQEEIRCLRELGYLIETGT